MGALKRVTGIGTFKKEIGEGLTENRFGKGKFSIPTGRLDYTRPKQLDAMTKSLKPPIKPPTPVKRPMPQYGDKKYSPIGKNVTKKN